MSTITDQWTGNGLAEATALTAGNVDDAGNFTGSGVTWGRAISGSPTQETLGDGFVVVSGTSTDIARLDGNLISSVTALRAQAVFTPPASTTGTTELLVVRNSTATVAHIRYYGSTRTFASRDSGVTDLGTSPAVTAGDEIVIDVVLALSASPTGSNGRLFFRLINNTDTGWNTTGYHFYDSLYTKDLQTANFTIVRFGKVVGDSTVSSPGLLWEFCGLEGITVNPADTSEQDASAYFADNPVTPYALESGAVTAVTQGYRLG